MPINSDKTHRWADDTRASVDMYNEWFVRYAPETYRRVRQQATADVLEAFRITRDLRSTYGESIAANPGVLPVLRMATAPPIAVDRLAGLAGASRNLVATLEAGSLPNRMPSAELERGLDAIAAVITQMLDRDLFEWLSGIDEPSDSERQRAASVVADRLTLSVANPEIRNAQEARQLAIAAKWLEDHGYVERRLAQGQLITMDPGTYAFRMNIVAGLPGEDVNIPIDLVIQPQQPRQSGMPVLLEAKSAGDFANVNKSVARKRRTNFATCGIATATRLSISCC